MERRSTSTANKKDVDAGDGQGNSMGIESLKESLNALLKSDEQLQQQEREGRQQASQQDDHQQQQQQQGRHQHRRISSGAQRIMDRLASLRTHNINNHDNDIDDNFRPKACSPRHNKQRHRQYCRSSRGPKTQHNIDSDVIAAECCENDLDTSFTTATTTASSLYSSPSSRLQGGYGIFVGGRDGEGGGQLDHSIRMQHEEEQPQPKQHRRPVERRKSIPRHRNLELNSTISSCLKPARYTSSGSGSVNSSDNSNRRNRSSHNGARSSLASVGLTNQSGISQRSFTSSLSSFDMNNDTYNDNSTSSSANNSVRRSSDASSSWVASGVVIADLSEEIRLRD